MPIERHQDYLLNVPSVPVNGVRDVPLLLDSDAPFLMRLVRSRNVGDSGWQFQTPRRQYQSTDYRTDLVLPTDALETEQFASRGSIVYPQLVYPPSGEIVVSIGNTTGSPLVNAQLLFRGSKLFNAAAVDGYTYPPTFAPYPQVMEVDVTVGASGADSLFGQPATVARGNQLVAQNDADIVIRAIVADPLPGQNFSDVYVQLKDEAQKPYSNVPIHINDLAGRGNPALLSSDGPVLFFPGLLTPEIYLPRRHTLYFDVYQLNSGASPVTILFRFMVLKVFAR